VDLTWLTWTLGATVVWGLGTLAAKPSTDRLGPRAMGIGATTIEGLAFGLVGSVLVREPLPDSALAPALGVLAGVAGALGYVFFFEGMRWGSVGLVGTITAAYPVITVALSVAILQEDLSAYHAVGIAFTILCVLLLAYEPKKAGKAQRAAVALSLAGFVAWGLWGFLVKAAVEDLGAGNLDLFLALAYFGVALAYAALRKDTHRHVDPPSRRTTALALFVFLAGAAGAVALTVAYDLGPAALVGPVSGTYPIIATLGAAAFLKEKLHGRIVAALVAFLLGLVLLSM